MTLPNSGPATLEGVKSFLGGSYAPDADPDDPAITNAVRAANAFVRELRIAQRADGRADWAGDDVADVVQGTTQLAARLFRRKDTPDGVAQFGTDSPLYVARTDPDVSLLLQLGPNAKPAVG